MSKRWIPVKLFNTGVIRNKLQCRDKLCTHSLIINKAVHCKSHDNKLNMKHKRVCKTFLSHFENILSKFGRRIA